MKILSWLNDRTGFGDLCEYMAGSPVPGGVCFCKTVPCVIAFLFSVQAITGFFLWAYYSPSSQTAWESVYFFQHDVAGGWLLRAIHHYSANMLLGTLILAVVQSIFRCAYRAPRELVFWATVGLGLFALAAILTGDLLSWDQNGYAATKTRTGFLPLLPYIGNDLLKIAIGGPGPALGSLSLTRFFALHVGLFAGGFAVLLIVRDALARRAGAKQLAAGCECVPYWPAQAWRSTIACVVVLGVVLVLACQIGPPLLSPADTDPSNAYDAARPEWFLTGVYEFSHLFPGEWAILPIFVVPGVLLCIILAMPFIGKRTIGQGFNVLFTVLLLATVGGLTYHSYAEDRADPAFQKAVAVERWRANRVCELIQRNKGIPPSGALSLLRSDPKAEGPRLFAQHCASCHNHVARGFNEDIVQDILIDNPTAPNLAGFASRRWIAGLLDPKKINGPDYFGGTKFRGKAMPDFVKETFSDLDADQKKDVEKIVAALSAEAGLPSQKTLDAKDAKMIAEGRKLIVGPYSCTTCHKFHDKGSLGSAPDLTGYGSSEWISRIVCNPADKRFYGKLNDRMLGYATSNNPSQNLLIAEQIKLLTDWLRGE